MFEIKNVSKRYNEEFALHDISLTIQKGMNFIVGASGSGKTTLLKIMSSMEQDFEGEVRYCDKQIKSLSANEKSYFYNNVFGFVWQDYNLLEDSSVYENVLLPQYLKDIQSEKTAIKILKDLEIFNIASQKVKYLSGGQKQRAAIARELMKNPQVIFADEPTSALDENTSKKTMDILRRIAKNRIVIVVTHDTSFLTKTDQIYELDKGELLNQGELYSGKSSKFNMQNVHSLSISNAFHIAKSNIKNRKGRTLISMFTLVLASILLLTTVSGTIKGNSQNEFDKLQDTYGESLYDISIIKSFTDASGTDGKDADKPSGDVEQDIKGLYELYAKDERTSFITYIQAFDNIKISVDDKNYSIEGSGSAPSINKLISGKMPMGDEYEVVVPESFIKKLKLSPEQAIGKEIDFKGSVYNWSSGQPVSKKTNTKAKIVGVMDTTVKSEYEGKITSYTLDDAFFFSKAALDEMWKQAGMNSDKNNFMIRAKTASDMIAIKDELSKKGIVPLGQFELVEDMVRLNTQASEQSGSAGIVIGTLSLVMVGAIFLIAGFMRRKEYAIYKISGFKNTHLSLLFAFEMICIVVMASTTLLVLSPMLNIATMELFHVNILQMNMLISDILLLTVSGILAYIMTTITFVKTNIQTVLKSGNR